MRALLLLLLLCCGCTYLTLPDGARMVRIGWGSQLQCVSQAQQLPDGSVMTVASYYLRGEVKAADLEALMDMVMRSSSPRPF